MEEKIIQASVHWRVRSLVENSENAYFIKIKNFDEFVKKLRENYMIYSKLRRDKNGNLKKSKMEDSERDKNDVLYDDKYLSEALEKVRNIINEVLDENEKLRNRVTVVPPPSQNLFKLEEEL